eukprot:CAMPEP_0115857936 /NCGR_PEP_ID=MMETSP0287-20121206/15833_1 /TAXON_ID=412157 /ORGANISM="Chrysochromulina rotalis, Strain UIO044" /LENGTH=70 /DNA_ID=CAMNT_0003312173 /DNA_START=25 /DNA_END=237 /DNA_ORIENTATION=+
MADSGMPDRPVIMEEVVSRGETRDRSVEESEEVRHRAASWGCATPLAKPGATGGWRWCAIGSSSHCKFGE